MEQALEIVKKAVAEYDPERKGKQLKAARVLLSAIVSCRRSIEQKAKVDSDSAQKMARDLEDLLDKKASFRDLTADKKDGEEPQTPPSVGQHLDLIQNHLKGIVKEQQEAEAAVGREWVKAHPVFNDLKETIAKSLPKNAYILLFRQKPDNSLELITQAAQDGRIFTRLRPHEFGNEAKLHRIYRGKLRVVGAAVLAEKELLSVFGQVPPPEGNKDQLQTLLGLSSKAAARPATEFMESNDVLKQLNELSHRRKIPKDAYILLFRLNDAQAGEQAEQNPDDDDLPLGGEAIEADASNGHEAANSDSSFAENLAEPDSSATEDAESEVSVDNTSASDASIEAQSSDADSSAAAADNDLSGAADTDSSAAADSASADASGEENAADFDSNNDQNSEAEQSSVDDDLATESLSAAEASTDGSSDTSAELNSSESQSESKVPDMSAAATSTQAKNAPPAKRTVAPIEYLDWGTGELVTRTSGEGKIITRFWPADFVVKHKVYDTFRGKPAIVGAAVIKHSQLFQAIGRLPRPQGGKSALEAVLQMSRSAVEKPVLDYLADNEVLKSLYDLANSTPKREGEVVLFTVTEQGRADIMPMITSAGQSRAKIPLSEFQSPKAVHDRFASREKVAGASVIGEEQSFKNRAPQAGGKAPPDRSPDRSNRRDAPPPTRQVVFAAYGRTPLKTNLMCTPETLKRLGVNLF